MSKRVWPELEIGSVSIHEGPDVLVRISAPDIRADLLRVYPSGKQWRAFHDPELNCIFVCATVPDEDFVESVAHEYLHACFRAAGSTPGDFFDREEQTVEMLTPFFAPFMRVVWNPRLPCTKYREEFRAHAAYVRRTHRRLLRASGK